METSTGGLWPKLIPWMCHIYSLESVKKKKMNQLPSQNLEKSHKMFGIRFKKIRRSRNTDMEFHEAAMSWMELRSSLQTGDTPVTSS